MKNHPDFKSKKLKINKAFASLRRLGVLAEQEFACCNSCGHAGAQKLIQEKQNSGYVFYHAQDMDSFKESSELAVRFGGPETEDDLEFSRSCETVAATACGELKAAGLNVEWNGDPGTVIFVR